MPKNKSYDIDGESVDGSIPSVISTVDRMYYLLSSDSNKIWIANQDGEGMEMSQDMLFDIIHEWFQSTLTN